MRTTTVLFLILILVLLAGCGGGSKPPAPVSQNQASAQANPVSSQNETAAETNPVPSQNQAPVQADSGATPAATNPVPTSTETPGEAGPILNENYPNALPIRNQLALGALRLEQNPELATTPEQAVKLLPYWQALSSVLKSGSGASAEIEALQTQIQEEMTPEQLQAIAAMQLSQADMQAEAKALGVNVSSMQSMMNQNLTAEERATRQAQRAASGQQGPGVLLMEKLVELLTERAS